MYVVAQVIPFDKPAADGSVFSYDVVQEYIMSERAKMRLITRTCVGSITHIYRDQKRSPSTIIAVDDQMLLEHAITHYVTDFFIKNNWLMATMKILDENVLDDKTAQKVKFVKGLLSNGIKLPVSATVQAQWNNNKCVKLIDIVGVDFTLDPSFANAGVTEIKK
jgi:hypothetical protein